MVWHQNTDAKPSTFQKLWCVDTKCECPCTPLWCGPCAVGTWWCGRVYFSWRSMVLNNASSYMWDNWYFPMILLRNGPLTLTCIASLMVLAMSCETLPTMEKLLTLVWWPVVLVWSLMGVTCPEVFLKPFPKGPGRIPFVLLITLQPVTLLPVYYSTFLCDVFLVLLGH